jgi:hypothetical protein
MWGNQSTIFSGSHDDHLLDSFALNTWRTFAGVCCQHQSNSICRENIKVCQRAGLALCGWGKLERTLGL